MLNLLVLMIALAAGSAVGARAPEPSTGTSVSPAARAEVLVLGVFHMANPGRDIFNLKADDVLSPKRQSEMAELVKVLSRFRPTKIAVEADVGDDRVSARYADYLAGKHELTRNEVEQIGFRLARELGHKTLYPVDADGDFPFQRVVNFAKASGRSKELDAHMEEGGAAVKAQGEYLASHTLLETLLYMNDDERVARDVGRYFRKAHFGEPGDWAGADLVSDWFRRNMRIYSNIVGIVGSPEDRVLVIFGAGHLGWLRHDFASDPDFTVRTLADIVNGGRRPPQ